MVKIAIGLPTRGEVHIKTVYSLLRAVNELSPNEICLIFKQGTYIHEMRNQTVELAIHQKCDYLMFIDSDITFPPDGITKLIGRNKDIIGGMYNHKELPQKSTIRMVDEKGEYLEQFVIPEEEIFKVYGLPTGFMLIKLDAIKDIKDPFDFGKRVDGTLIGEDINFCIRAKEEQGIDSWCDPTITIKHIGDFEF